ncbi:MAG: hypothetical protein Q7T66_08150 [Herminiimonas sp.]|uniref:hypothetical protein n=1 Tax=Herminiimonas sp. TaxID=1926289 RepID=UPI002715E073|nr:hypothetical protein [Herminiimonas sp.]MDO9420618.1 hypothetical protein [Herminiimonas sp.]
MKKLLLTLIFILAGCASTEFKPFEAKNNAFEGTGGTKLVVEGIDVWENGDPPRKYKIIGIIEDERAAAVIPKSMLISDIAKKAKDSGGDAIIKIDSNSQITGFISNAYASGNVYGNNANTSSFGATSAVRRINSRFAVIKYIQ